MLPTTFKNKIHSCDVDNDSINFKTVIHTECCQRKSVISECLPSPTAVCALGELETHTQIFFANLSTEKTIFANTVRLTSLILRVATQKPQDVAPNCQ